MAQIAELLRVGVSPSAVYAMLRDMKDTRVAITLGKGK